MSIAEVRSVAPRPTAAAIKAAVGRFYGVRVAEIDARNRRPLVVQARHVAMFLCRKLTWFRSFPQIGLRFADRDHTTVLHADRKIRRQYAELPQLAASIDEIERRITGARA